MRLVERMTGSPPNCLHCGRGNTPDGETGEVGPFLDVERDVNWGDDVYYCMDCVGLMAAYAGWITPDDQKAHEREVVSLNKAIHDLQAELTLSRRGRDRAEKELKVVATGEKIKRKVAASA